MHESNRDLDRIERLEARLRGMQEALLVQRQDIWLVETREVEQEDPAALPYPLEWDANVFRAILLERAFSEEVGSEDVDDQYESDETDPTKSPDWIYLHGPWYLPRRHKMFAWYDRAKKRWFAIDEPDDLFGKLAEAQPATYPEDLLFDLYERIDGEWVRVETGEEGSEEPVQLPAKNPWCITPQKGKIYHVYATWNQERDKGWWTIEQPTNDLIKVRPEECFKPGTVAEMIVQVWDPTAGWSDTDPVQKVTVCDPDCLVFLLPYQRMWVMPVQSADDCSTEPYISAYNVNTIFNDLHKMAGVKLFTVQQALTRYNHHCPFPND